MSDNIFEEPVTLDQDSLGELAELCRSQQKIEEDISNLEEALKQKKRKLEYVSRELIPSLLNSKGLSEIKLWTGEKILVQDKIKASIANKNNLLAYRNMVSAEGGDSTSIDELFKSETIIEDISDDFLDFLLEKEIPYTNKKTIHPQTLKKYCKEKLERGEVIPEGISVFQYQETKIKK